MEEPENSKTWFIMHDGERSGPYSMEDLKAKVELHEINPRLDMAWEEGMEDWISAGEVDGLFSKNTSALAAEKKDGSKTVTASASASASNESEFEYESSNNEEHQEWEGVSRGGYFFFSFIFPALWWVGGFYGITKLAGVVPEDIMPIVMACVGFLPILISIFAALQRFQNLAMSRLWLFGLGVPLLQIWLAYRLFACPPGYAQHKKLGGLGWFLAVIFWLPIIAFAGAIGFAVSQGPDKYKDVIEKNRGQYEEFMLKVKEQTATPEETEKKKAEEKAKQGPSITPIPR